MDKLFGRAMASLQAGKLDDAERHFKKVLKLSPRHVPTLNLIAIVYTQLKKYAEADRQYKVLLAMGVRSDVTFYNYGLVLMALSRSAEALECFNQSVAMNGGVAATWSNRGSVLNGLGRHLEALSDFERAVALQPALAEAWAGRANALNALGRYDEARAAQMKVLTLKPTSAEGWAAQADAYAELQRYDDALRAYDRVAAINPDYPNLLGARLHVKMKLCDWHDLAGDTDKLLRAARTHKECTPPFVLFGVPASPADQLSYTRYWAAKQFPAKPASWVGTPRSHERIRLAYLSSDFHEHATAYLAAGVFEHHDRSLFEVTAISVGADDNSAMRQRLEAGFEHFIDASMLSEADIAALIRDAEIDILIDLKGFTLGARSPVLACRPAPIQVNYLGYPGTMGVDYIDYLIADHTLIPKAARTSYAEKIVYLPNSYQANDASRTVSAAAPSRAELGLPQQGFVFCCFNNNYKILPEVFDIWMRLLKAVDGSVLWLLEDNTTASSNLRREAEARGVSADRLVFAKRALLPVHLARQRAADLFLDTAPYNAHTTASDALWVGLPVLTKLGDTFAGRVAASLLKAVGLPELIAPTWLDYERVATELATNPGTLAIIKEKLARDRTLSPLFDTALFTRHIEQAYAAIYKLHATGTQPDHIDVATIS